MGNSNTLMFKVGIADIKAELDKHKKEIESWVNSNPIKLKVQLEDSSLEQLAAKLKAMGATFGESNEEIKKMKEELNALRTILDAVMNGTSKKESAATNELRVMTKGAETAVQAMNQLSTVVNETMSRAGSGKGFMYLDRVPAIYSKLMFDIENRMTAIGNIMSKGNLPSWLDNGQGRGYMNNVFADYERLLKTMQRFKEEGFIDFHNVLALKDVFRGLESAYGPIIKQAGEYNKQVEKQASDVAKFEQQKAESIRKAEEKGEKERSAARAKEEKEYDKFWQKNLNEREKAQANAEAKQAKEAELYTKNSIKNYNTWQESIRRAGVELTTIGIKIRQLEQTEARAKNAGVDTSSIKARIEALKQEEQILTRIHNGEKGLGTAKDYIRSESYQRELKLAQEVNAVTNKSAIEKERADNKDIKNLEIKEANQRRYNSLLNDMEGILNRVSRVESKGGLLGLDTANISGRIKELQSFIDKTLNMDMRNLGDNGYISNLRAEWNALKKSINEAVKEQERLNTAQEKSNTAAIKAQASEYKSLKKSTQEARKEAEKLVADRQKMLQDQASSLSKIMFQGKGKLDSFQYEQTRDALRAIREELRQIEIIKQRGGLSTSNLLTLGQGSDFSSMINAFTRIINGKKEAAEANGKLSLSEQQLVSAIKNSNSYLNGQSQVLSDLKMMATQYLSVWGAQSFINNIIELGGQLEQQRLSIGAILQDTAQANHLFSQIKALAIKSPFGVQQLDQMSKQLSAYSFKYSELYDWTKRLADISAATGTSVDRLALALGHVRSEGALSGYTLRQFSMGNIPLLEKLSENLGKTKQEIRKMTRNKEIGYEDVLNVLKQLTEEGGMFYNAQEIMAEALNAKFKNLRDSFQIMYSEMAEGAPGDFLKGIAETLTDMSRNWKVLMPMLTLGASAIGAWKIATMAFNYEAARTGKLMTMNAIATSKYSVAQLRAMAGTSMWTIALRGLGRAFMSLSKFLFSPITLGFAAVEGLVYLWQKHNQEVQKAKELSEQYGLTASESQKNIGKQLESNGAYSNQMSDSQLKTGIESMIESLKNYRADAQEIINTIYGADAEGRVMSLADKYKYLRKELEKTNDIYKEMARTSDAFEYGINYGDGGWFDENVETDLTDYANKLKEYNNAFTNMVADHGVAVHNALEIAKKASPEFRKVAQELSNDADRIRWIYENRTENRDLYNTFNSALGSESGEMLAWNLGSGMKKAEKEANEELDKFMTGVEAKLKEFGYDFSGNGKNLSFVQVGNLLQQSKEWLEKHPEWQNIYDVIWDKLNKRWGIPIVPETEEVEEKLPKWMEDMQKELDKTGIKLKADMSMEQIVDEMKKAYDKAQTTINKLGPIALNAKINIAGLSDEDIEAYNNPLSDKYDPELYSTLKKLKGATDSKKQVDAAANKRGIKLEGMKKDGSHQKEKQNQENAKAVREQVRIIKEAADAYQYWRDKVGDKGAWAHVRQEFGKVLDDLNITADNIEDVRKHLNNIPNTKAYKAIKDKKIRTEIKKEISKENDQYIRKDFEKSTEEFLSRTQIELDNLTRSWEMFNSVRDATGDVELAVQLSGAEYASGKNRNLADAIKEQIQKAFNDAGGAGQLDFNKLLSDKEIEKMFQDAKNSGGEYEKNIKSLVEAYKKWRDLQRDVMNNDIQTFAKIVGGAKDYQSQLRTINDELKKQIEANQQLVKEGVISQSDADVANENATIEAREKAWKASIAYSILFNNTLALTSQEINNGINRAMEMLNERMEHGLITAQEYAEEMEKIRNIQSEWNKQSLFGMNNAWGAGIKGGSAGRVNYYKAQIAAADKVIATETRKAKSGQAYNGAALYDAYQRKKEASGKKEEWESTENLMNDFDALAKALDPVVKLFDELGMKGIGGVLSAGQNALSSAASTGLSSMMLFGAAAGPYGAAIGAGLSLASSAISAFGADYSSYEKAKAEYENLISVWDDLIERKRTYLNESWGTEASNAAKESILLLNTEIEQTKVLGRELLKAGASMGSHSIGYRMWQGSYGYNGQNWKDVASEISRALGGVKFTSMEDMLNMTSKQLVWIKENYTGLWASMDGDFKEHLDNIIKYGDDIKDILDDVDKKLHGLTFDELVDSYYDFVTAGEDANDVLAEDLESKLKEAIVKGMIQNLYQKRIESIINQATESGKNDTYIDSNGNVRTHTRDANGTILDNDVASEYTKEEYALIKQMAEALGAEEKATYEMLKAMYGWTDNRSSSGKSSSSIKNITEETADLLVSYSNGIRLDVSVIRAIQGEYLPLFLGAITSANTSLANIENNTAAIMASSDAIQKSNQELVDQIKALRNKTWRVPVA